jgi:MOSC domain-containing protein YiiM
MHHISVGTILYLGEVLLEVTQIGKEDHHQYDIKERPREYVNCCKGVFARVLKGGIITCDSCCYYFID